MRLVTTIVLDAGWTRETLLAVVDRELRLRGRVYPRQQELGRMSADKAREEIAGMKAVRAVLEQLPTAPPAQGGLFGDGGRKT